jgi:hypothetical protein
MKIPHILSILILAAGSFWGIHEYGARSLLRGKYRQLEVEAATLGLSTDASKASTSRESFGHERTDSSKKVKDFANAWVASAKEIAEIQENGSQPDAIMRQRSLEFMSDMLSLRGMELKLLIAELKSRTDINDETRKKMIGDVILTLAEQHPETALAMFAESFELLDGESSLIGMELGTALGKLAEDKPLAALEWTKKKSLLYSMTDDVKRFVISGAARNNIDLAFQVAGELKMDPSDSSLLQYILSSSTTPEKRAEALAAVRKLAATINDNQKADDLMETGLFELFSTISGDGYAKTMEWITASHLSPQETTKLAGYLAYYQIQQDTGKWIEWITSQKLEPQRLEDSTDKLIREWTKNDYKAAGEWLAQSPAGPVKETATLSYLETIAPYDPETAVQWADTLPEAKKADVLKRIHNQLKKKDADAAKDFAQRHGIQ